MNTLPATVDEPMPYRFAAGDTVMRSYPVRLVCRLGTISDGITGLVRETAPNGMVLVDWSNGVTSLRHAAYLTRSG